MGEDLSGRRVRAVAPDDRVPHSYVVFADDRLLRTTAGSARAEVVAEVPNIRESGDDTGSSRLAGRDLALELCVRTATSTRSSGPTTETARRVAAARSAEARRLSA